MRLDRNITLTRQFFSSDRNQPRTVILMYHSISDSPDPHGHPYYRTVTPARIFDLQMQWIRDEGAKVVPLAEWDHADGGGLRVVITFDDGFADFDERAVPVMQKYGYTATMFLPTGYIGTGKTLQEGTAHLSWDRVNALTGAGFEFGSHTVNHHFMGGLSAAQIREEISGSTVSLTKYTGRPPRCFSCPFAYPDAYPDSVRALTTALKEYQYAVAVTTRIGTVHPGDDPLRLKRIPVNGADDHDLFAAKLHGHYDWLYNVQYVVKQLKHRLPAANPAVGGE